MPEPEFHHAWKFILYYRESIGNPTYPDGYTEGYAVECSDDPLELRRYANWYNWIRAEWKINDGEWFRIRS